MVGLLGVLLPVRLLLQLASPPVIHHCHHQKYRAPSRRIILTCHCEPNHERQSKLVVSSTSKFHFVQQLSHCRFNLCLKNKKFQDGFLQVKRIKLIHRFSEFNTTKTNMSLPVGSPCLSEFMIIFTL